MIKIYLLAAIAFLSIFITLPIITNSVQAAGNSSADSINRLKNASEFLIRKEKNITMINRTLTKYQKKLGCVSGAVDIKTLKSCGDIKIKKNNNLSVNKQANTNAINKIIKKLQNNISCISSAQDEKKVTICRNKKG